MSVPPELRILCLRISSTSAEQLPRITPALIRDVLKCQEVLSFQTAATKAENSETAVLIHKLKTQVSGLLYGKSAEGRFTAAALIKAIVDVGGATILSGVEPWVRGLLAVLGKSDPLATKRLCVLTLTDIFLKTQQSQTFTREITTPSLPTFVSSCLNLISSKSAGKVLDAPPYLKEIIFESFCTLVPSHPAIFRPFSSQIKLVTKPYLAPASYHHGFVPLSLKESARRLYVLSHQTAAKNTGGEEWGKTVRALVKDVQANVDHVYRAVVEDWESTVGYVATSVDVNRPPGRDSGPEGDGDAWVGIDVGIERLVGQLDLLAEFFKNSTPTTVTIPLAHILDLITRLMSVAPPRNTKGETFHRGLRLHPGIDRDEREGLWAGLNQIHITSMNIYSVLVDRLLDGFTPTAQSCLEQLVWTFTSGSLISEYRLSAYTLLIKILPVCGSSLPKAVVESMGPVILACCKELQLAKGSPPENSSTADIAHSGRKPRNGSYPNAGAIFLESILKTASDTESRVLLKAYELLPLFISSIPQQYLEGYLRVEIDRTAIVIRHKDAMLASVLNPYQRKSGRPFPSILPHLCRVDRGDPVVESLLRPRMPIIQQAQAGFQTDKEDESFVHEHEQMEEIMDDRTEKEVMEGVVESETKFEFVKQKYAVGQSEELYSATSVTSKIERERPSQGKNLWAQPIPIPDVLAQTRSEPLVHSDYTARTNVADREDEDSGDSDTSVHLVMDMSESEADDDV